MDAAWQSSLESVDVLLSLGADPNILNKNNNSAFWYALDSNNLPTVKKLLPVSDKGLEAIFQQFPKSSILYSEEVKSYIRNKLDEKPPLILTGLKSSSEFGHVPMLTVIRDFLRENVNGSQGNMLNRVQKFFVEIRYNYKNKIKMILPTIIDNAIKMDKYEACAIVKDLCELLHHNIQDGHYLEAVARKNRKVINLFAKSQRQKVDDNFSENCQNVSILNKMPKTADISYNDEMEKIRGLILENEDSDGILSFDNLLEKLHVKKVHYK